MRLVLASASPRRKALLAAAGVDCVVRPSSIEEARLPGESVATYVRRLALEKARAVHEVGQATLAADTVVHIGDELFEKPTDDADARAMLARLSGGWHQVTTAACLLASRTIRRQRTTRVRFRVLSADEIAHYVGSGEGRDKAGSYAIQGQGAHLVDRIVGCYTTVVGLPLPVVVQALDELRLR